MTASKQREPCLSDLSDARWALMKPTLTAWQAERQKTSLNLGGKVADLREVMNAILFLNRTGIPWRYLPHDFPPHTTVFGYFSAWTADGTIEKLGLHLHRMVREQVGRTAEPTACVIDAQSVKTATSVPTDTQGTDAAEFVITALTAQITAFEQVTERMRHRLAALPAEEREEIEEASTILRKARAGHTHALLPLTPVSRTDPA